MKKLMDGSFYPFIAPLGECWRGVSEWVGNFKTRPAQALPCSLPPCPLPCPALPSLVALCTTVFAKQ
jgi:hypothetical protein